MQAVIMAGGKGTRIASIASDIPKPMIRVAGKPILQYQIECLLKNGLKDIIIVTGHLGSFIKDYFKDGSSFGVNISYYDEEEPLGTAGALYKIIDILENDFILLCGDIIFDIDFSRFISFYKEKKALAALVVHPNSHPFDSSLIVSCEDGSVSAWLGKEREEGSSGIYYKNEVNSGMHIISKKLLLESAARGQSAASGQSAPPSPQAENKKIDLDRDVLRPAVPRGGVFAYSTPEYIKDMGTPDRYAEVLAAVESGLVGKKNLCNKQRAIFIDRDGTISETAGFVKKAEDLHLKEGAAEAVRRINASGFLAILITNQPVIARGDLSLETLNNIHNKVESELGKYGAYLDAIYYCPHHPDKGFEGERLEYKIDCECRKPKAGMLLKAAKRFNIDLKRSWMIGDSWRDVEAGRAAGCKSVFIGEDYDDKSVVVRKSVLDFVKKDLGLN